MFLAENRQDNNNNTFLTQNTYLWFYKEECIIKPIFILRPLWEIMIKRDCSFRINIEKKLNTVNNKLEKIVFGRQTFPELFILY